MNLNLKAKEKNTFDAIVVGSGISGGWAAKELCEKGLKVLLLDRGKDIKHIEDYKNALKNPWEMPHANKLTQDTKAKFPIQTSEGSYPINEANKDFWMPETISPYIRQKPFDWYRGGGVGGKSMLWGRQVYRWGDHDFTANLRENIAIDWPIRYKDIAPWYAYVEKFIGVSGTAEGLAHVPDSVFQPAMDMNCVEAHFKQKIKTEFTDNRLVTIGRVAHITKATKEQMALGRASCQYRNACSSGCPYGAFFSTQSATLPAAKKTGNLTIRPFSVVSKVLFNEKTQKADGVEVIDSENLEAIHFYAKIIFLNASTVATSHIMLNSISARFPNGLGNDSDQLGRNLMDHHSRVGANASVEGFEDKYYVGRRANGIFIPRFRNLNAEKRDYIRGFDYQGGASRTGWNRASDRLFGANLKASLTQPGGWSIGLTGWGETLPYQQNTVFLHRTQKDKFGMPTLVFDAQIYENEKKMRLDMANDAAEMLEAAGYKNIKAYNKLDFPLGLSKHEMGTARMGNDPKTSVLNGNNQVWGCKNVFVTDGACMTSSNCVNPSLTYMALTARACAYAVKLLKSKEL